MLLVEASDVGGDDGDAEALSELVRAAGLGRVGDEGGDGDGRVVEVREAVEDAFGVGAAAAEEDTDLRLAVSFVHRQQRLQF